MLAINNNTRIFGIIGHPLAHTLSPVIHNAAFEATGINAVYLPFETSLLKEALGGLLAVGCGGLSITLPFKERVIEYLHDIDPLAEKIGAVNTLVNNDGSWVGYNTDPSGALRALQEVVDVNGKHCVIIGAGGAARAIGFALREKGCVLTIINRSRERGERLATDLNSQFIPTESLPSIETQILIQATPVGMYPRTHLLPIDPERIKADTVMDIVYNPAQTLFLRQYRLRGSSTISGLRMFLYQAAEQFKLWTGKEAPLEVMKSALSLQTHEQDDQDDKGRGMEE